MDEDDQLYDSLRRLSNSTAMSTTRLRRVTPSPIPYTDVKKDLTFTLNEVYYHDGKSPINEKNTDVPEKLNCKRNLYKREIKSIGTSLKNCDVSDVVSIDIDPESTRLPLMCKLMIIVEGAAFERGTRVLVRDASCQAENDLNNNNLNMNNNNNNNNSNNICNNNNNNNQNNNNNNDGRIKIRTLSHQEKSLPVIRINHDYSSSNENSNYSTSPINVHERNHSMIRLNNHANSKYRSSESINYEAYNSITNQRVRRTNIILQRNIGGGSLTNLHSPVSHYLEEGSNYFNRKKRNHSMLDSSLDMDEYNTTPYYQYMRKNLRKKDFACNTTSDLYEAYKSTSAKNQANLNDLVEVHIPIKVSPQMMHRNEKRIFISRDVHTSGPNMDTFRAFTDNMRRYLDERINRFEAEITFFNLNEKSRLNQPLMFKHSTHPMAYAYHYQHATNSIKRGGGGNLMEKPEPSVTNLMLMQIVDGRLIE